jgi:hypothetical protein
MSWKIRGSIPEKGNVYIFRSIHVGSEAHPVSYSRGTDGSSPVMCDRVVKLTAYLHVVPIKNEWRYASAPPI